MSLRLAALLLCEAATAAACLAAALRFRPGDHLRRAWSLQAASYGALAAAALVVLVGPGPDAPMPWLEAAADVAANVLAVASALTFAATYWKADLGFSATRAQRAGVFLGFGLLAMGFALTGLIGDLRSAAAAGTLRAWIWVASDASDVVIFLLAGPVLLLALGLRGGTLAAVWWLITAGNACWIAVDAADGPLGALLGDPGRAQVLRVSGQVGACVCWAAAALVQRQVAAAPEEG